MHALQTRSSWARARPPLSRRSGSAALRYLSRPGNIRKGAVCSQDFHTHDRDRPAARPFDDPHQTPPPRPAAAAAHQHHAVQPQQPPPEPSVELPSSLSTSDLEFGADALSGSTLETPEQLAHQYRHPHQRQQERERQERLHQADIAREAAEAREAAQGIARLVLEGLREDGEPRAAQEDSVDDALFMSARDAQEARQEETAARSALAAGESTAAEREDRYAGILQALDSLGARDACGASDDEGQALSPEAARLTTSGSVENEEEAAFDVLRHTVDMLGEGEEAAELIMESYKGRNLEAEALSTLDPADSMPHPGDRYLRPNAARGREPPPGGMAARLNSLHSRPDFERRHGPLLPPARGSPGSQGQQFGGGCRGSGASAWMPPGDAPSAARAQHDPVGEGSQAEGQGDDPAPMQAGAQGSDAAAGRAAAGSPDDQIGLQDAWRHAGPVGKDPGGSGAGTADDQIDFEQDVLRGADALYYAPEHAATPAVNDAAVGGRVGAGASGANVEAPEEGYDVEGDALRGSDSMFYFKAAPGPSPSPSPGPSKGGGSRDAGSGVPAGEGEKEQDQGTVWGALASRDEQHGSFRRAMEEAAAEASSRRYANDLRKAAGGKQHLPADVAEPPRAPPPAAATGKGEAPAGTSTGDGGCQQPCQGGILSSLRRRQGERKEAERSLERLVERLHPTRGPGDPGPPPAARVIETAMGRSAALGLCAAFVTEVLTQQSVLSQLLGRFEGSYQIELARSSSQAAALGVLAVAVLLTLAERVAGGGTVPHWRPLGLAPTAQVWLGRGAMILFALLLAFETVHSNRPAFGTLFYLWP